MRLLIEGEVQPIVESSFSFNWFGLSAKFAKIQTNHYLWPAN